MPKTKTTRRVVLGVAFARELRAQGCPWPRMEWRSKTVRASLSSSATRRHVCPCVSHARAHQTRRLSKQLPALFVLFSLAPCATSTASWQPLARRAVQFLVKISSPLQSHLFTWCHRRRAAAPGELPPPSHSRRTLPQVLDVERPPPRRPPPGRRRGHPAPEAAHCRSPVPFLRVGLKMKRDDEKKKKKKKKKRERETPSHPERAERSERAGAERVSTQRQCCAACYTVLHVACCAFSRVRLRRSTRLRRAFCAHGVVGGGGCSMVCPARGGGLKSANL